MTTSPPSPKNAARRKRSATPRLSREDWIRAALDALQRGEIEQLKVELLATALKVTKGSFYWHFENWADFVGQLLDFWNEELTTDIKEKVKRRGGSPEERLLALAEIVEEVGGAKFDLAMHAWALKDEQVAQAVDNSESIRLRFVRSLFKEMGFEGEDLEMRTRTFVVFASFQMGLRRQVSKAERLRHTVERVKMLVRKPAQ